MTAPLVSLEASPTLVNLYSPILRVEKSVDNPNFREVYGPVSDDTRDIDEQRCDPQWLRKSLTAWFDNPNLRAMHQPVAVGRGIQLIEAAPDNWELLSKVVDPDAVLKVDEGLYTGYSIGVKFPKFAADASAPRGRIVGGHIVEVSLVDRPANFNAKFSLVKMAEAEEAALDKAAIAEKDGAPKSPPKGYPTDPDLYADPTNFKYPLAPVGRVRSAISRYNGGAGKDTYSDAEWATMGRKIAAAATKAFGKSYSLSDGEISSADAEATKVATASLLASLGKAAATDMVAALGLDELSQAQLALVAAELTRRVMIAELSEAADPNDLMQWTLSSLGAS